MKKLYLLLPILILLLYGGCSNGNNNECVLLSSEFMNSECLAEDMIDLCVGISCETTPHVGIGLLSTSAGSATDCSTIECNDRSFTELAFNAEDILFSTVILDGENLGNVECRFFQNQ
ncbi:MAG: hypothetical protein DHS20C13_16240 [Thermodesulfobacteriota bacterium]|nr:MAG: hypothetical protein DHS20C13_16240 [Thermodesulfobacteriota bacterium]